MEEDNVTKQGEQDNVSLVQEIIKLKKRIYKLEQNLKDKDVSIRDLNKSTEVLLDELARRNSTIISLHEENEHLKTELSFEKANAEYYYNLPWWKKFFKF